MKFEQAGNLLMRNLSRMIMIFFRPSHHVLPSCQFARERRSIVPRWEELLLFNDDFKGVFENPANKNIVMFFEVIDFLSMAVASKNFRRLGQKGGWYQVAWAFKYTNTHKTNI